MHLAIRADGGPEIGYGHLIRSNALTEEMLARGNEVTVATTTPNAAQSVFPNRVNITELRSRDDPEPFVDWLAATAPDIVFTDAYPVDTAYQKAVREQVRLAVLQDDDRHAVCADLFTNGNLYAPDLDYEFVGREPKTCLGTNYILLRSEIRKLAQENPPWRAEPERAIVVMGGSDIENLTPTVVRAFNGFDLHLDVIVGPGVSDPQEEVIRNTSRNSSTAVSVVCDPDDLPQRMFQADFAVSTSSSTTYELLALGTPIISIPVVDNQEPIAEALRNRDAATVLEQNPEQNDIRQAIRKYVTSSALRQKRRERGRELVDGRGAKRLCPKLLSLAENDA
jgi:UDP-2,4-diacetamido-2,4,6-trideoxy-beta-L-altropyranose hydrolase